MQAMLRGPSLSDDGVGGAALALPQGGTHEWVMSVMPGGFDEHAPQVGIARFGDGTAGLLRAAGMLGRHETDEGHGTGRRGKPTRIAEFGRDRERGQIVDAAEAAQALDAWAQRLEIE